MEMLMEIGTDVISPPRVTNIPRSSSALTVSLEGDEPMVLEVR